jgi:hypothetical protein
MIIETSKNEALEIARNHGTECGAWAARSYRSAPEYLAHKTQSGMHQADALAAVARSKDPCRFGQTLEVPTSELEESWEAGVLDGFAAATQRARADYRRATGFDPRGAV